MNRENRENLKNPSQLKQKKNIFAIFDTYLFKNSNNTNNTCCRIISEFLCIVSCFWSVIGCLAIIKKNRVALRGTGFCGSFLSSGPGRFCRMSWSRAANAPCVILLPWFSGCHLPPGAEGCWIEVVWTQTASSLRSCTFSALPDYWGPQPYH